MITIRNFVFGFFRDLCNIGLARSCRAMVSGCGDDNKRRFMLNESLSGSFLAACRVPYEALASLTIEVMNYIFNQKHLFRLCRCDTPRLPRGGFILVLFFSVFSLPKALSYQSVKSLVPGLVVRIPPSAGGAWGAWGTVQRDAYRTYRFLRKSVVHTETEVVEQGTECVFGDPGDIITLKSFNKFDENDPYVYVDLNFAVKEWGTGCPAGSSLRVEVGDWFRILETVVAFEKEFQRNFQDRQLITSDSGSREDSLKQICRNRYKEERPLISLLFWHGWLDCLKDVFTETAGMKRSDDSGDRMFGHSFLSHAVRLSFAGADTYPAYLFSSKQEAKSLLSLPLFDFKKYEPPLEEAADNDYGHFVFEFMRDGSCGLFEMPVRSASAGGCVGEKACFVTEDRKFYMPLSNPAFTYYDEDRICPIHLRTF